jgi:hypothetical protein
VFVVKGAARERQRDDRRRRRDQRLSHRGLLRLAVGAVVGVQAGEIFPVSEAADESFNREREAWVRGWCKCA